MKRYQVQRILHALRSKHTQQSFNHTQIFLSSRRTVLDFVCAESLLNFNIYTYHDCGWWWWWYHSHTYKCGGGVFIQTIEHIVCSFTLQLNNHRRKFKQWLIIMKANAFCFFPTPFCWTDTHVCNVNTSREKTHFTRNVIFWHNEIICHRYSKKGDFCHFSQQNEIQLQRKYLLRNSFRPFVSFVWLLPSMLTLRKIRRKPFFKRHHPILSNSISNTFLLFEVVSFEFLCKLTRKWVTKMKCKSTFFSLYFLSLKATEKEIGCTSCCSWKYAESRKFERNKWNV